MPTSQTPEPEQDGDSFSDLSYDFFSTLRTLLKDEKFLNKLDGWVEKKMKLEEAKLEFQKNSQANWENVNLKAFKLRIFLSGAVVLVIGVLAYCEKIEPAVVATLLSAAVGSLFIVPKK